jgi:hypothetical protein
MLGSLCAAINPKSTHGTENLREFAHNLNRGAINVDENTIIECALRVCGAPAIR